MATSSSTGPEKLTRKRGPEKMYRLKSRAVRRDDGTFFRVLFQGLNGSPNGFLFSVPAQLERLRQMQGGLVQRQALHRRPQIQHVAVSPALRLEALADVLAH